MKTRLTEFWKPSRIVITLRSSSRSKLPKVWSPPPVKKASAGLAEYLRSSEASSVARRLWPVPPAAGGGSIGGGRGGWGVGGSGGGRGSRAAASWPGGWGVL